MIVSAIRKDSQTPSGTSQRNRAAMGSKSRICRSRAISRELPLVPEGLKGGGQDDAHRGDGEGEGGPCTERAPPWRGRSTGMEAVPQQGAGGQGQQDSPRSGGRQSQLHPEAHRLGEAGADFAP